MKIEYGYYSSYVEDLILKARAYEAMKTAIESDICTISIVAKLEMIITNTEVELHAADRDRKRAKQNI